VREGAAQVSSTEGEEGKGIWIDEHIERSEPKIAGPEVMMRRGDGMSTQRTEEAEVEVEAEGTLVPARAGEEPEAAVFVPGMGNVTRVQSNLGPGTAKNMLYNITFNGFTIGTDNPFTVLVGLRQADNRNLGFPDTFAYHVIDLDRTRCRVRISRRDSDTGWGQRLLLSLMFVD
jgi:hypothetical protein